MTLVAELVRAVGELPVVEVDVNVVRSWLQFVAEVTAVVVIILSVRKRSDRKLEKLITEQTQPIQPGYRNGGASLQDMSVKLEAVSGSVQTLTGSVRSLEVSHAEQRELVVDVRERVVDLSEKVRENRDAAEQDLATLSAKVDANAATAAGGCVALQGRSQSPSPEDGPDLD